MRQRDIQALNTRAKIFSTARRMFYSEGCKSISIDDICEACDVSKGAFYHHFKTKNEIIAWILFTDLNELAGEAVKDKLDTLPTPELLTNIFNAWEKYNNKQGPEHVKMSFRHSIDCVSAMSNSVRGEFYTLLQSVVLSGKKKGDISAELSENFCTEYLINAFFSITLMWSIGITEYNSVEERKNVLINFYSLITPKSTGREF